MFSSLFVSFVVIDGLCLALSVQMIKEAIEALKEKTGSSPYAIAKYTEEKRKGVLPANFRKMLAVQLKNAVARGKLLKVKNSFKLSDSGKKGEKKPLAEKKEKKAAAAAAGGGGGTKRKAPVAKVVKGKKPVVVKAKKKKMASAKPKQPKSIKSPAGKRARKATA